MTTLRHLRGLALFSIFERDRCSSLSFRTMTTGAVLGVEHAELLHILGTWNLGALVAIGHGTADERENAE